MSPGVIATIIVVGAAALGAAACLARPWRQAMLTLEPVVRFPTPDYDYERPDLGYPLENPCKRAEVRDGHFARPPFDEAGIPVVDYRWMRWADMPPGRFYNAITVSQYALWGCWIPWLHANDARDGTTGTTADTPAVDRVALRAEFLAQAEWLLGAQGPNGEYVNRFPLEAYGIGTDWVSGMAQGQAASVLVRAHLLTGEERYVEAARRALSVMLEPVSAGGALCVDAEGTWIEEAPSDPPSHILNGLVFAWWGLWDYLAVREDPWSRETLDAVARTLAENVARYTSPKGVRYDLRSEATVDRGHYMPLQIAQLEAMHRMTGDQRFAQVAGAWRRRWKPRERISWLGRAARAAVMAAAFRAQQASRALRPTTTTESTGSTG